MTLQLQNLLDRATALKDARKNASQEFSSEDFSESLFVDGKDVHYGFQMRKPDRDLIALSTNETESLMTAFELVVKQNEMLREALKMNMESHRWLRQNKNIHDSGCVAIDDLTLKSDATLAECAKIDEELGRLK